MAVKATEPGFMFPLKFICLDGRRLVISQMDMYSLDIAEMYREITKAAEGGKGYGLDEYETESEFRTEVKDGHNFVFKDADSLETVAWLSIYSGGFSRSAKIVTSQLVIADTERGKHIGKSIGDFSLDFCAWCGYDGMLCDFFAQNRMSKSVLVSLGFKEAGTLSICGKVKHRGYVGCEFMFYDLRGELKHLRSMPKHGIYTAGISLRSKL